MSSLWSSVLGKVAGISDAETQAERRGFDVSDLAVVQRLESIGCHFVWGYNRALRCDDLESLTSALEERPPADAGFAYEGAAMGLAVRDWFTPWHRLLDAYIAGPAHAHEYMSWVGAGWAFGRL